MSRRFLELIGVITVILAVAVLLRLASVADPTTLGGLVEAAEATGEQGQTEAAPAAPTPWGEADLQGIWTTQYEIPLQRPARFADQEFFTEEQRAELDGERARTSLIVDPPNGRVPPLTPEAQERQGAIREYRLALL